MNSSSFGKYGMEPTFDNYGMNSFWMWYDSEDGMMSCWMDGETHTSIFIDENGDYWRDEADLGPGAIFPQPLGPSAPDRQGPRPWSDTENYDAWAGFGPDSDWSKSLWSQ